MTKKIIYIMSDNRSGSTLLDQLLGANPSIMSLGEVHHLTAYSMNDRSVYDPVHPLVCSCGDPVTSCEFWLRVEARLGRPISSLRLRFRLFDRRRHKYAAKRFTKRTVSRILVRYPRLISTSLFWVIMASRKLAFDSFALFDAVFKASSVSYLVDSSKSPRRLRVLYDSQPQRMVVIMLARNYKGTVHSKMKRGKNLEEAVDSWASRMYVMKKTVEDIPEAQVIRVRYEDLCANPADELRRICDRLDIEFSETMLARPSRDVHHVGGSPSKFDPDRKGIAIDESYLSAFSDEQLQQMHAVANEAAQEWGYD